jgi:hypothetical protein
MESVFSGCLIGLIMLLLFRILNLAHAGHSARHHMKHPRISHHSQSFQMMKRYSQRRSHFLVTAYFGNHWERLSKIGRPDEVLNISMSKAFCEESDIEPDEKRERRSEKMFGKRAYFAFNQAHERWCKRIEISVQQWKWLFSFLWLEVRWVIWCLGFERLYSRPEQNNMLQVKWRKSLDIRMPLWTETHL